MLLFLSLITCALAGQMSGSSGSGSSQMSVSDGSSLSSSSNTGDFIYPNEMPSAPLKAQAEYLQEAVKFISKFETPIQVRILTAVHEMSWNCVASYHKTALDVITKKRPLIKIAKSIIKSHGNSKTRMLCFTYAVSASVPFLIPDFESKSNEFLYKWGLNPTLAVIDDDVMKCSYTNFKCLNALAEEDAFTPDVVGKLIAYQILQHSENDGWNANGLKTNFGKCTANCQPFDDFTGYKRENLHARRKNKYRWHPLQESNGKGFYFEYDHVTPHIGLTSKTKVISRCDLESTHAPNPKYNYKREVKLVIKRLAKLAVNDTKKMMVEFFDNKIKFNQVLMANLANKLQNAWTYEERQLYAVTSKSVEFDTVIQAWLSKRRWDLIRPTSLIKRMGKKKILTWGGPFSGLQKIKGADFESYKRVMPHAEYPSGSACICLGVTQFTKKYLSERHDIKSLSVKLPTFLKGSSKIENGLTPQNDINLKFNSLKEYYNACASSRLMGGMHFTASIFGGQKICDGIGEKGFDFMKNLLDGKPL